MATPTARGAGSSVGATIEQAFVSAGCNRSSGCGAWSLGLHAGVAGTEKEAAKGLVAYGACNLVALYDPVSSCVLQTLSGHDARVNTVAWVTQPRKDSFADENELVSGDSSGKVIVWQHSAAQTATPLPRGDLGWRVGAVLDAHSDAVTCVDTVTCADGSVLLVTCGADASMTVWHRGASSGQQQWTRRGCYKCPPKAMAESVTVAVLPRFAASASCATTARHCGVLVAAGCVDAKVRLYTVKGAPAASSVASAGAGAGAAEVVGSGEEGVLEEALVLSGHQDWVRSLQLSPVALQDSADLMLATCSNDRRIRVWRIADAGSAGPGGAAADDADDADDAGTDADDITAQFIASVTKPKSVMVQAEPGVDQRYNVSLETVLVGHEHWVNSVRWCPPRRNTGGEGWYQPLALISASMDRTITVWLPDSDTGLWVPATRFGVVGGRTLGFFGGLLAPDCSLMMAHGYHGSLHQYVLSFHSDDDGDTAPVSRAAERAEEAFIDGVWTPQPTVSGHAGAVMDVAWGSGAAYLLSVSSDQTCRAFAPWQRRDDSRVTWREIARPQIHGYDMMCCTVPPIAGAPHRLVSGGDEKVLRVFDAPASFVSALSNVPVAGTAEAATTITTAAAATGAGGGAGASAAAAADVGTAVDAVARVRRAYIPELGLSNKGVAKGEGTADASKGSDHDDDAAGDGSGDDGAAVASSEPASGDASDSPPLEEDLLSRTMWVEVQKLYGHGNELVCAASNHAGTAVASACKAREAGPAAVWLWDSVETWKGYQSLPAHSLTVVQLAFSPDDRYLLSVSKDRQVCVFECIGKASAVRPEYKLIAQIKKAHKRIIWSCSWHPSSTQFATGSRDGSVKLWTINSGGSSKVETLVTLPHAVTAVAFTPAAALPSGSQAVLAVGTEPGGISLWRHVDASSSSSSTADAAGAGATKPAKGGKKSKRSKAAPQTTSWTLAGHVPQQLCPRGHVRRLAWRCAGAADKQSVALQLAVGANDHSVRVLDVNVPEAWLVCW